MTVAVVSFPGSNCDRDCVHVVEHAVEASARLVWHRDAALPEGTQAVILPGGFSYGDYLRCGAMAGTSPVMKAVRAFADAGGPVLGICNGFQVLCEVGLLPGALLRNRSGLFICEHVELEATGGGRGLLADYAPGERIRLPIAHGEGNYFADEDTLAKLEREGKVAFRYVQKDDEGNARVNGSRHAIAGIMGGPDDNVVGLMPHPERRSEDRLGGTDGLRLMAALVHGRRGAAATGGAR